jgi:hypothetical protein
MRIEGLGRDVPSIDSGRMTDSEVSRLARDALPNRTALFESRITSSACEFATSAVLGHGTGRDV